MKSIKTKLIFSFLILIFGIASLIGFITLENSYLSLREEAQKSLKLLAREGAMLTESRMEILITTLEIISKKQDIIHMRWEVKLEAVKEELSKTPFLDIAYILPNGYANFTDGTVRLMSDRSYVKKALKGEASMSDVILSRVTRKPEIEICVPIMSEKGITGALLARTSADTLGEITKDSGYGHTGYAFMINGTGRIIASPDVEKVIRLFNPLELVQKDSGLTSLAKAYQMMLNKKSGLTSYEQEGESFYTGFAQIKGTDWIYAITADKKEVFSTIPKMMRNYLIALSVVLIISMGFVLFLGTEITRPIKEIAVLSRKISEMDLSENISEVYLKQGDEIGVLSGAFQTLTGKLREMITTLAEASSQVTSTAQELTAASLQAASVTGQISDTISNIAQGAQEQADNTDIGFMNSSQLGVLIEKNNEYVIELNHTTKEVHEIVISGLSDIVNLSQAAEENQKAAEDMCNTILQTKSSSEQIIEASNIISEMARQTQLLALNASIEASRAGEAGRGFAVVAEEIQKMADQSAASTKYIDGVVKKLMNNVKKSSERVDRMKIISEDQHACIQETIRKYQSIAISMKVSEEAVERLNASKSAMSSAKNEILNIMQILSAIAEQNAAGTEQTAAIIEKQSSAARALADTSNQLITLACNLQDIINNVKI